MLVRRTTLVVPQSHMSLGPERAKIIHVITVVSTSVITVCPESYTWYLSLYGYICVIGVRRWWQARSHSSQPIDLIFPPPPATASASGLHSSYLPPRAITTFLPSGGGRQRHGPRGNHHSSRVGGDHGLEMQLSDLHDQEHGTPTAQAQHCRRRITVTALCPRRPWSVVLACLSMVDLPPPSSTRRARLCEFRLFLWALLLHCEYIFCA